MLTKLYRAATVLVLGIGVPAGAAHAEATKTTQDLFITSCEKATETSAPEF
jgi:hypothetical protein